MKMDSIELEDVNSSKLEISNTSKNDFQSSTLFSERSKPLDYVDLSDPRDTEGSVEVDNTPKDNFIFNRPRNKFINRIGNTYAFWFDKNDEPRIVIGPHWPFYICLSSIITLISYSLLYLALADGNFYLKLLGWIIYLFQISSYTYTFLINPGLPNKEMSISNYENKENVTIKVCERCGIVIKPGERTYHCDDCGICIIGYDHHCPWTSKCIGKGNLTGFYIFVTFTMILFGYLIFAVSMISSKNK